MLRSNTAAGKIVMTFKSCEISVQEKSDTGPRQQWSRTPGSQQVDGLKLWQTLSTVLCSPGTGADCHSNRTKENTSCIGMREEAAQSKFKRQDTTSRRPKCQLGNLQMLWNQMAHWRKVSQTVRGKRKSCLVPFLIVNGSLPCWLRIQWRKWLMLKFWTGMHVV